MSHILMACISKTVQYMTSTMSCSKYFKENLPLWVELGWSNLKTIVLCYAGIPLLGILDLNAVLLGNSNVEVNMSVYPVET